jgi:serine/threonine protein kinase
MILEAGYGDLMKYMDDSVEKYNGLQNALYTNKLYTVDTLLNLVNSYKVSEYFLKKYNKIFIHNDIKIENIVYLSDSDFKFIDFGFSELTDKFFNFDSSRGTEFFYSMLYDIPELNIKLSEYGTKGRIKSPLYDMFCICISIFEFVCYNTLDKVDKNINLYQKLGKVKKIIEKYNFTKDIRNLINNLIDLTTAIYDFQQNNINILLKTRDFKKYIEVNDMKNFIVSPIYDKKPPVYENIYTDKLSNDYFYFDKIVQYYLNISRC